MGFEWKIPSVILISGRPLSGKSNMAKYIINWHLNNGVKIVYIFSSTMFNGQYDWLVTEDMPFQCKFLHYDEKELIKIMNRHKENKIPGLIIFDDMATELSNEKQLKILINNYRHYNLAVMIAIQYYCLVDANTRGNCAYQIIFESYHKLHLSGIYQSFGGMFKNEGHFMEYIKQFFNVKYQAMLIDSYAEPDQMFYKISSPPPEEMQSYKVTFMPKKK